MGSRDPYGSNRVKAYLNDIPITGGDGVTVLEDLSLTGLGRIVFEQPELSQAERLVDLFPRSAYTHALRGGVHLADGSLGADAAERDFRRALELDPD